MIRDPESNSIDTIRRINQVAREFYHKDDAAFDHASYLRECFNYLVKFFKGEFCYPSSKGKGIENAYLFSALSYKNEDSGQIEFIKIADGNGYDFAEEVEPSFSPIIDSLLQAIKDKRSMSLTETLLKDKRKGKVLFLYSKESYKWPVMPRKGNPKARIEFFCLSSLKFDRADNNFDSFFNRNRKRIQKFQTKLEDENKAVNGYDPSQIGTLLWHYWQMQEGYLLDHPGKDFIVHFIRPTFIEFGYNILLSLCTNRLLQTDHLALTYMLVYRIISQTVIEKTKEAEEFKRRTSFSLTTHALKTELQLTLKTTIGHVRRAVEKLSQSETSALVELAESVTDLESQYDDLYCMTAFVSLIDKIDDRKEFRKAGKMEKLLQKSEKTIDVAKHCSAYNKKGLYRDKIRLSGDPLSPLSIKVYDLFFCAKTLRLFLDTIIENANKFGKRIDKQVELRIFSSSTTWIFENDTNDEQVEVDVKKIRGNLFLFKLLIEKTGSGKLTIDPPGNHKFRVTYEV